jgi:hypothetical protein
MNVVFLDVDGVLNSERSFLAGGARVKQYTLDNPDDPYWLKITRCTIDPVAIDLVNRICDKCDAKLVISSTHRKHFKDADDKLALMQDYFYKLGLRRNLVIGWTESLHTIRGIEIQEWLERHPEVNNYVILDDSSDMLPEQMEFFVRCDGKVGVSSENYFQMLRILGGSESALLTLE